MGMFRVESLGVMVGVGCFTPSFVIIFTTRVAISCSTEGHTVMLYVAYSDVLISCSTKQASDAYYSW